MSNITETLSLIAPAICNNSTCEHYRRNYNLLCYKIDDAEYAQDTFEEDGEPCPCCNQSGYLDKPFKTFFDFMNDGLIAMLCLDDFTLDTLINLLRNMQDADVRNFEQVFLATDEAYNIADSFHVVDEFANKDDGDVSYTLIPSYPFDERNKVIVADAKGLRLQVDISNKNDTQSVLTTVATRTFTLADLLALRKFAYICNSDIKKIEDDDVDLNEIEE
jgi:hypothetical protein